MKPGPKPKDYTGLKANMLTALRHSRTSETRVVYWWFRCDCGVEKEVIAKSVAKGLIKSCGCASNAFREAAIRRHTREAGGHIRSPEYAAWNAAKHRCTSPKAPQWERYGGRGIAMHPRWLHGEDGRTGFDCFFADMGARPSPRHTLDRLDNDRGYEPGNCAWRTVVDQNRNRSTNRLVTIDGSTTTLSEAAEKYGINIKAVKQRIHNGWDPVRAVVTPLLFRRR